MRRKRIQGVRKAVRERASQEREVRRGEAEIKREGSRKEKRDRELLKGGPRRCCGVQKEETGKVQELRLTYLTECPRDSCIYLLFQTSLCEGNFPAQKSLIPV